MRPDFAQLLLSGAVNIDLDLTAVAHLVLFCFFVVIMKPLIFDPLMRVFEERERRTTGAIDKAREMDEKALELKAEYDDKLDDVRREAAVDRDQLRAKTTKLESELLDAARGKAGAHLDTGMSKIHGEADAIRKQLTAQRPELASEIASRVLGRRVDGAGLGGSKG